MFFPFVSHFFAILLYCLIRQCQFVFLCRFSMVHIYYFVAQHSWMMSHLRCNPYIMCITRNTGYFDIMHTVIWFCPINKQFLFWCGIVHWFRTIFCLCWHEITISNTSLLTGTSPATLNWMLIGVMALGKVWWVRQLTPYQFAN